MDYSIKAVRTDDSEIGPASERYSSFSTANPASRSPRLASALQATLDLESLVTFFAGELRGIVPCEGIEYVNDLQGIHIITGELRRHRCSYALTSSDRSLGQMVFTRGKRFNKSELALLESLLSEIFWPLQRALQHRQHRPMRNKGPTGSHAGAGSEGRRETDDPRVKRMRGPTHGAPAEAAPADGLALAPLDLPPDVPPPARVCAIDTSRLKLAPRTPLDESPKAPRRLAIDTGGLSLAPLGPLSETPAAESTVCIDTSHLSLVTDEGQA
jgi:hypothetical protein